jgi:DHA2 family multidrug resistance protein
MHAHLVEYVTPFNNALQMPDVSGTLNMATDAGRAMMDALVNQQAAIIAYANDFKLLTYLTLVALPFVLAMPAGGSARGAGLSSPAVLHQYDLGSPSTCSAR